MVDDEHHYRRATDLALNKGERTMGNFHEDARTMILEAAERSGLLRDVAQFIWFTQQLKEAAPASCVLCLLRDDLTEVFEESVGSIGARTAESIWGEGLDISPRLGSAEADQFEQFCARMSVIT